VKRSPMKITRSRKRSDTKSRTSRSRTTR
jgi:hypothetical protein